MAKEQLPDLDGAAHSANEADKDSSAAFETETIDLNTVFAADLTVTGSFDMRGAEAGSLGKLLNALPIPALLISTANQVVYTNSSVKTPDTPAKIPFWENRSSTRSRDPATRRKPPRSLTELRLRERPNPFWPCSNSVRKNYTVASM